MPEFETAGTVAHEPRGEDIGRSGERSARVLGVLERKLAARESRGCRLDAESVHLRLRIAELRAGVQADPLAAIAVLEPALARAGRGARGRADARGPLRAARAAARR
jgi:hypothetical protein